ncbi:T9SS type A sorting domain-containing protein [uncultured Polaribacter sp.]|uniref:DUF6923 family protein n=1 Tax=uncultured Polaribacter sp. TaxID=174711 RepID=UPI00262A7CAE|nr:T9SS type A sorting domain-containing protein [uncultured Polaribacter sp.]
MNSPKLLLIVIFNIITFTLHAHTEFMGVFESKNTFLNFNNSFFNESNHSNKFKNKVPLSIIDNDPCTDGAIVGTVTANDPDADGINNICDLDDDNDGILDEDELCTDAVSNFPSPEKGYLFQGNPTNVYLVDIATGISTLHQSLSYYINGAAINEADGLIWAVEKVNNFIVLIDPSTFNIIETLTIHAPSVAAAYDPVKKQFVTFNKDIIQVIDGNPNSPTYKTQVASFPGNGKGIVDLGYNTSDGGFYGIPTGSNKLYKIDTVNENVTLIGEIVDLPNGTYGAIYTTLEGKFYMSNNTTGVIYEMELKKALAATVFSNGPAASQNDGAKVINVDINGNLICLDTDNDGISNSLDLDSDGDGFTDVEESGGIDTDKDGDLDGNGIDTNGKVTGSTGGYAGNIGTTTYAHQMSIITPPTDQTTVSGESVSFSVVGRADMATNYANGIPLYDSPGNATDRIIYQWYLGDPDNGGTILTDSGVYTGTNSATLNISSADGLFGNDFYVKLTHLDNIFLADTAHASLIGDPCDPQASGNPDIDLNGVSDICQSLIISQYVESNSGTGPKGIEIFNLSPGDFDFSETNIYINVATEGNPNNYTNELVLNSGILPSGEVIVIGSSEVQDYLNGKGLTYITFIQHDFTFDGDDTVIISESATNGGTDYDMIGELTATDPGDNWSGNGVQTSNSNISVIDFYNDNQFVTGGSSTGWSDPSLRYVLTSNDPAGEYGLAGFGEAPIRNVWLGTVSDNFHTTSNWKDTTHANLSNDNVLIPTAGVTYYPRAYEDINLKSIKLLSGAQLKPLAFASSRVMYEQEILTSNWYLIGSPLTGHSFTNDYISFHNIPTAGTDRAFGTYETTDDTWSYLQSNIEMNTSSGVGYQVKKSAAGILTFTGFINDNDVNTTVANNGQAYNLISNPYTSNINSYNFLIDNIARLEIQVIWLWNQEEANYESHIVQEQFIITPTQGFFVKVKSNFATNLVFNKGIQCVVCEGDFQKVENSEILLKMTDGDKNRIAKIFYNENATATYDEGLEGETFGGGNYQNPLDIYTHLLSDSSGVKYQIQSLPNSDYENMIVPVGVTAAAGKEITIKAEINNLPSDIKVTLEDRENNTFTELNDNSFKITLDKAVNGIGRFYLHTTSKSILNVDNIDATSNFINIYNTSNNNLTVEGLNESANIRLYSIQGKEIFDTKINSNGLSSIQLPKLSRGVYIVSLKNETVQLSKKIIIK